MFTTEVTPENAKSYALHYVSHSAQMYDGYTCEDAADMVASLMVDFLLGDLTYDVDLAPLCDEWCL